MQLMIKFLTELQRILVKITLNFFNLVDSKLKWKGGFDLLKEFVDKSLSLIGKCTFLGAILNYLLLSLNKLRLNFK